VRADTYVPLGTLLCLAMGPALVAQVLLLAS
jgi:hypothetical protein